jgi:hypothetical protein
LIRDLVRDPICVVTRGSSYENRGNLAPSNKASFTISGAGDEMAPRHKPPRHTPDDEHVLVDDDLLDEVTDDHR